LPEANSRQPEYRARPRSVLIVEDEVLIRFELAELLGKKGVKVLEAANAAEAMEVLESGKENIDLVLTDVCMPRETDGLKFVEWLKETRPALPVVLCTSLTSLVPFGGPIIRKPYDPDKLVKQVEASLESGRDASPAPCRPSSKDDQLTPSLLEAIGPSVPETATAADRAKMYRDKASEIRCIADGVVDAEAKAGLLGVAESYLQMALTLEAVHRY
jgi:CheY-like chemotaxis protein